MLKFSNKQKALIQYIGYPILVIGVLFLIVLSFIPPKGYFTELRPVSMSKSDFEMNTGLKILEAEIDTVSGLSEQHQLMGEGSASYFYYYDEKNEKEYLRMKPFGKSWDREELCNNDIEFCFQHVKFPEELGFNIYENKEVLVASHEFSENDWYYLYMDTYQNIMYLEQVL